MATTELDKRELIARMGTGMSLVTTAAGIALIVLGILALANIHPPMLISIATIIAGIALLVEGAGLAAKYANALANVPGTSMISAAELGGGLNAGALAGAAGIVLGILAILGIVPEVLTAVALIVFGAAVLFDFFAKAQLRVLRMIPSETSAGAQEGMARVALSAVSALNTAPVLIAIGLIVLGIIALVGMVAVILVAVAFLGFGTYLFLDGTAAGSWLFELLTYY
ncbi:MAG: hypothetical protein ACREQ4_06150 [Candidatus Binataceae bacterium]